MQQVSHREHFLVALYALALLLLSLLGLAIPVRAFAADLDMPVPTGVIYPGQAILERGVSTAKFTVPAARIAAYAVEEAMLADKVARRTLLPNQPILLSDLKAPNVVTAGVPTPIVYREGGVFISGLGTPLSSAGEGDAIRVRNVDSGITVAGIVQANGTIEVGTK